MFRYGRRVAAAALLIVLFALAVHQIRVFDPDLWWHLRTGQVIVESGDIPRADIFSFTNSGKEWIAHEWLSEVILYGVFLHFGAGGLVLLFAAVIVLAFALVMRRSQAPPLLTGGALALGALASLPTWGVRPQMFTLLLASVFLYVLGDYVRGRNLRRVWVLAPLMVLWANLHGGFLLGLVLIALAAAGLALDIALGGETAADARSRVVRLCLVLAVCVFCGLLTPHGLRLYSYPLETLASHAQQTFIAEWNSPNFQEPRFLFLAALMLATFSALALSPKRVRPSELLLLLATCFAALRSGRHIPFLSLVAIPLLAEHTLHWAENYRLGRTLAAPEEPATGARVLWNVPLALVPALFAAFVAAQVVKEMPVTAVEESPAAAVDFIESRGLAGPIYNTYGWGGYLIWRLYPEQRVFIDGRADVYGDEFFERFVKVYRGVTPSQETFERYSIRTVLIEPHAPLATSLRQQPAWEKVFEDDKSVVFVR